MIDWQTKDLIDRAALAAGCHGELHWAPITAVHDLVPPGRRWTLVTSAGWLARGIAGRIGGDPQLVIAEPRPQLARLLALAERLAPPEVIVAIGGGSAIDAAKALAAFELAGRDASAVIHHALDGDALPAGPAPVIIAAPTTAGTGAELTPWASMWLAERKCSLHDPRLEPRHAVIDPALAATMPREVALAAGLDAAAHAMEAVWNRNHAAASDALARAALARIVPGLPRLLDGEPVAEQLQVGALLAGIAMRRTQTALAHSMSYVLSGRFGLPHGLACGFTLGEVARFNAEAAPERLAPIAAAFGCRTSALAPTITAWLAMLGVGRVLRRRLRLRELRALGDELIDARRAPNNLREADAAQARALVCAAFARLTVEPVEVSDKSFALARS
ncbi:MAG TPA: iron-containing alcohol dehydrogenase [Kofleriaceae bacterium]